MKDYKSWFRNREVLRESHDEKLFTVDDGSVQEEIEDQESHTMNNVIIPFQIQEFFLRFLYRIVKVRTPVLFSDWSRVFVSESEKEIWKEYLRNLRKSSTSWNSEFQKSHSYAPQILW